jgi:predicted nucleic acid-binding protein
VGERFLSTNDPENMFWDSCVFIRYLTESPPDHVGDIQEFIKDARAKKRTIYFSTLVYTEIRPRFLKAGTIHDFFEDLSGTFVPVDPTPNVFVAAGAMRDLDPINPSDPKAPRRSLGTPDSIHLATCLHVRDTLGVPDIVFHTFDDGKGKNWEGRCVPLLSFERWYPAATRSQLIGDVCNLPRLRPAYPQMRLFPASAPGQS